MKVNSIMDLLGLTVVAVIILDIVGSKNTASDVSAAGNTWSGILKAAGGK